jgi:hypothetical protein
MAFASTQNAPFFIFPRLVGLRYVFLKNGKEKMDLEHSEESILNNLEIGTELLYSAYEAFESGKFISAIHIAGGVVTGLPRSAKNLPVSLEEYFVRKEVLKAGGTESGEDTEKRIHDLLWAPLNRVKHHDHPYGIKKSELPQRASQFIKWAGSVYLNNVDRLTGDRALEERIKKFGKT